MRIVLSAAVACTVCIPALAASPQVAAPACTRETAVRVGTYDVTRAGIALVWKAGMAIDADGAPNAYHPTPGTGLDHLANAGKPGNWWGVVTDDGTAKGSPVVQGPDDPFPGYYVSPTSLVDKSKGLRDPKRYVDSTTIPYLALPPEVLVSKLTGGARLGDYAAVIDGDGDVAYAIVADVGPKGKLGEGSIALADALGIPSNPRRGGRTSGLTYVVFAGSGDRAVKTRPEIEREGARLLEAARKAGCVD